MQKTISAVIFDLDGVIIDSNPEIEKFWHRWAAKTGRQLTQKQISKYIHGRKGVETLEALFNDISPETKEQIIKEAIEFDSQMNPEPISGIYHFIQSLCSLKIPLGVVTSSHKQRAVRMLEKQGIHACFQEFVTAEDVSKGKPHPEPYSTMAKKLNTRPEDCLVFEDAISGVQSARAAGMEVIGINNKDAAENLLKNGVACVVAGFNDLCAVHGKLFLNDKAFYTLRRF